MSNADDQKQQNSDIAFKRRRRLLSLLASTLAMGIMVAMYSSTGYTRIAIIAVPTAVGLIANSLTSLFFQKTALQMASSLIDFLQVRRVKRSRIMRPPGSRLLAIAEFFCSKKTFELTFQSWSADFQHEYFLALQKGRKWQARWVRVRSYWAYLRTVQSATIGSIVKRVLDFLGFGALLK